MCAGLFVGVGGGAKLKVEPKDSNGAHEETQPQQGGSEGLEAQSYK